MRSVLCCLPSAVFRSLCGIRMRVFPDSYGVPKRSNLEGGVGVPFRPPKVASGELFVGGGGFVSKTY